jgi:DNA-3-methyladenine glycosylase
MYCPSIVCAASNRRTWRFVALLPAMRHRTVKVQLKLSDQRGPHFRLRRLRRAELPADTVELARYLIGKVVIHDVASGRLSGRIVETEAYPIDDAAGHAFRGKTRRNGSLFLARGHAYVYFAYGSSFLLNVTSEARGVGGGVLLRAIEPLEGIEWMAGSRGRTRLANLGRGPGRLTKALHVDLRQDGLDMCAAGPLCLAVIAQQRTGRIGKSVRIGITRNVDRLLRFYEPGNAHVSGPKKLRQ